MSQHGSAAGNCEASNRDEALSNLEESFRMSKEQLTAKQHEVATLQAQLVAAKEREAAVQQELESATGGWDEDKIEYEASSAALKAKVLRLQKQRRSSLQGIVTPDHQTISSEVLNTGELHIVHNDNEGYVQDAATKEDETKYEYLRNVVVAYMETVATGNHSHLMPVLSMLLNLTPEEVERVNEAHKGWLGGWF